MKIRGRSSAERAAASGAEGRGFESPRPYYMTSYTINYSEDDEPDETMVDLGGGMVVPLRELMEDDDEDNDAN